MGWSSRDGEDLRYLVKAPNAELDDDQKQCRRTRTFLERVQLGDLLFYTHVPTAGMFGVVRISGDYEYLPANEGINGDFRSCRSCSLLTPKPLAMRTEIPDDLRVDLSGRGRIYRIGTASDPKSSVASFLTDWTKRRHDFKRCLNDLQAVIEKIAVSSANIHGSIKHNQSSSVLDGQEVNETVEAVQALQQLTEHSHPDRAGVLKHINVVKATAGKIWEYLKRHSSGIRDKLPESFVVGVLTSASSAHFYDAMTLAVSEVFLKAATVVHAADIWLGTGPTTPFFSA